MSLSTSAVRKGALVLAFSVLAVAFCAVSLSDSSQDVDASYAPSGTDITHDGVVYTTIDGSGHVKVKDCSENKALSGNLDIPSTFVSSGDTYTVTQIAANAFKDDASLTGVYIPGTVNTAGAVGSAAFSGCSSLAVIGIYHTESVDVRSSDCFKTTNDATHIYYIGGSYSYNASYDTGPGAETEGNTYHSMPSIDPGTYDHGTITSDPYDAPGRIVTLNVAPDMGYVLKMISGTYGSSGQLDFLSRSATKLTFRMPLEDVTISATFSTEYFAVSFYESPTRTTMENVSRYHSLLLPQPEEQQGKSFLGWYADPEFDEYLGPAGGPYTPRSSTTLYALFETVPHFSVSYTCTIDGEASDWDGIAACCGTAKKLASISEDETGRLVLIPEAAYSLSVTSTDTFLDEASPGVYRVTVRSGISSVTISIDCRTLNEGISGFAITALTEIQRGASLDLSASSDAGLIEGAIHFSGVYCRDLDDGVRVYGAITDRALECRTIVSDYEALTLDGASVEGGSGSLHLDFRLLDSGAGIYCVSASYIYESDGENVISTPLQYGNNMDIAGGI